jgi:hypothetical protein
MNPTIRLRTSAKILNPMPLTQTPSDKFRPYAAKVMPVCKIKRQLASEVGHQPVLCRPS